MQKEKRQRQRGKEKEKGQDRGLIAFNISASAWRARDM
jgi:hypothetical protein